MTASTGAGLSVCGLFAGVRGIELGLLRAGHTIRLLCEIDPAAQAVLRHLFPGVPLVDDVRSLDDLGGFDMVAAGFPCQDLSQAGRLAGINGPDSGLVVRLFDLLARTPEPERPGWILLENVPFMLHLRRGGAIRLIVDRLESLGYVWAYRVVDTRAFGLPQRRRRVFLAAALLSAAPAVILAHNHPSGDPTPSVDDVRLTRRLVEAGDILGIQVLDHVIVGERDAFSFHRRGMMPEPRRPWLAA